MKITLLSTLVFSTVINPLPAETIGASNVDLFPLEQVRLLDSPFSDAVAANREYLLALDVDRLLAPFLKEAGLPPKAEIYGNWEAQGLSGHTAGHYLSALADMIASGNDADGELSRRLDYMLAELERCQRANGNGYVGGIPGSKKLWNEVASGRIEAHGFGINGTWVPWYNIHKTFAGLKDAYAVANRRQALDILVGLGDWCYRLTEGLSDLQMQTMLRSEHGGMNEALADIYRFTGDEKFLSLARRFNHHAVLDPLMLHEDHLTGMHANTQIPKIIGMESIGRLIGNEQMQSGADFFWHNVTQERSVAFGGNSVSEHFNDPKDFSGMVETREGPETCNTYNMLRLTEMLFEANPGAAYADYYEEALYNHLLSAINCEHPGYVYFTPIRPDHYRVYSQPGEGFWCCVGTGMENPGKYGEFIYAQSKDALWVNLFVPSTLGLEYGSLSQETSFPYEEGTQFTFDMDEPHKLTLHIRKPGWVASNSLDVTVNGVTKTIPAGENGYVALNRVWEQGDVVQVKLPMHLSFEQLPDKSNWGALKYGPIVLAHPAGDYRLDGLRADDSRMGHVAHGPLLPLDEAPVLISDSTDALFEHIQAEAAGTLHFTLKDVVYPKSKEGLSLVPFYSIHDQRYQMYWQVLTAEELQQNQERLKQEEQKRALLDAATIDSVAIGEQQPEVEHDFKGENSQTGNNNGRNWRHGKWFQYTLDTHGNTKGFDLAVTYWGGDYGRTFDIVVNGVTIATQSLTGGSKAFFIQRYEIPREILADATGGKLTIRFAAENGYAGGVYGLCLLKKSYQE